MAYDRYDRDDRNRGWSNERYEQRGYSGRDPERSHRSGGGDRGSRDERGFFERASEEISSWFGGGSDRDDRDHHDERYRDEHRREGRGGMWGASDRSNWDHDRGHGRDYERDRHEHRGEHRDHRDQNRGLFAGGGNSERDYNPSWREELRGGRRPEERNQGSDRGYQPMAGDYGRSGDASFGGGRRESFGSGGGRSGGGYGQGRDERSGYQRSQSPWGQDEYRTTSYAGSSDRGDWSDPARGSHSGMGRSAESRGGNRDPHYGEWRDRHMSDIDRDYDDYRRERQSHFESDFGGWREKRGQKRSMLPRVREHMEVVGNDGRHVGTIDKVAGDRLILTKSDPESGGRHHSISCHDVDRIEDDRIILEYSADQARSRWQDEDRSRAMFEREGRGDNGPHILDRSFEGTYRR